MRCGGFRSRAFGWGPAGGRDDGAPWCNPMRGPRGGRRRDPLAGSPDRHRLYRDPGNGVIFGVCAGLADYFGLRVWQMRVVAVLCLVFFLPQTVAVYLVLAAVLPRRPAPVDRSPDEEEEDEFRRSVGGTPGETVFALRHKFRELDERIGAMERTVISNEFKLDREIRNLDR